MLTQCPHCKQVYEVSDDVPLKTELQCPSCQNNFLLKSYSEGGRNTSAVQNHTTQNSNNSVSAQAEEEAFLNFFEKYLPLIFIRAFIILGLIGIFLGIVTFIITAIDQDVGNPRLVLVSTFGCILWTCVISVVSGVVRAVLETRDNTKAIRELLARNLENK